MLWYIVQLLDNSTINKIFIHFEIPNSFAEYHFLSQAIMQCLQTIDIYFSTKCLANLINMLAYEHTCVTHMCVCILMYSPEVDQRDPHFH